MGCFFKISYAANQNTDLAAIIIAWINSANGHGAALACDYFYGRLYGRL